jgi:hypothetical protein
VALKGNLGTLRDLKRSLQKLPLTTAATIARHGAPEVSGLARQSFDGGQTVHGSPRPRGVDGQELSLVRTGASRRAAQFTAEGTRMRTHVLPRYTKYLIGAYSILPNGPLPQTWRDRLTEIAARAINAQIFGGGLK